MNCQNAIEHAGTLWLANDVHSMLYNKFIELNANVGIGLLRECAI